MALNYNTIKMMLEDIELNQKALTNIRLLAAQLADTSKDVNVYIKIRSLIPVKEIPKDSMNGAQAIFIVPGGDPYGRGNAGPGQDFYVGFPEGMQPTSQPKTYTETGLEAEGMPNEIALIMLGSISKWYSEKLQKAKDSMDSYMREHFKINGISIPMDGMSIVNVDSSPA